MPLDLRFPLGFLFLLMGGILTATGAFEHVRLTLFTGLSMLAFGAVMAGAAFSSRPAR